MRLSLIIATLATVGCVGCGKGPMGPQGEPGRPGESIQGERGQDGRNAEVVSFELVLLTTRSYNPSVLPVIEAEVGPGIVEIPDVIELVDGAAGTGWATLRVGNLKYCYQGNGGNNNNAGTAFVYKGAKEADKKCDINSPGHPFLQDVLLTFLTARTLDVELQINGGGINSSLQELGTVATATLITVTFQ